MNEKNKEQRTNISRSAGTIINIVLYTVYLACDLYVTLWIAGINWVFTTAGLYQNKEEYNR